MVSSSYRVQPLDSGRPQEVRSERQSAWASKPAGVIDESVGTIRTSLAQQAAMIIETRITGRTRCAQVAGLLHGGPSLTAGQDQSLTASYGMRVAFKSGPPAVATQPAWSWFAWLRSPRARNDASLAPLWFYPLKEMRRMARTPTQASA
jgi:hypothetical protein